MFQFFSKFKYVDTIEFYLLFSYLNNWNNDEVIKFFSPGNIYNKSSKIDLNNKEDIIFSESDIIQYLIIKF